jgi:uncharacterized membrane protein
MNQIVDTAGRDASLKTIGHISYLLHLIVAIGAVLPGAHASVLLLLVAFVLDIVKRGDAMGTWQESHFTWRIRTVVIAGALYLVTLPLWLLFIVPGWIAWTLISVWFLYRIARGWMNLNNHRAIEG